MGKEEKFKLTNRKNYEQKKAARKKAVQAASVNVDDGTLPIEECELPLALPLTIYTNQTLSSLNLLSRRLHRMESINEGLLGYKCITLLIFLWVHYYYYQSGLLFVKLSFCQLTSASFGLEVTYSLCVLENFTWFVSYRRAVVDVRLCSYLQESPSLMNSGIRQHLVL